MYKVKNFDFRSEKNLFHGWNAILNVSYLFFEFLFNAFSFLTKIIIQQKGALSFQQAIFPTFTEIIEFLRFQSLLFPLAQSFFNPFQEIKVELTNITLLSK